MKQFLKRSLIISCLLTQLNVQPVLAAEYSASFKGTDIQEFINTVGKNLNKTIIVDPSVRGTINVRSYDLLNEEQYYQFFLSVLDVYGFAVVPMPNASHCRRRIRSPSSRTPKTALTRGLMK